MKFRTNESLDFPSLTNDFPIGYRGMKKKLYIWLILIFFTIA